MTAPMATRMAPREYRYEARPRRSDHDLYASTPRYASSKSSIAHSDYLVQSPPSSSFSSVPTSVTSISRAQSRGRRHSTTERPKSILRNSSRAGSPSSSPERHKAMERQVVVQQDLRARSRARSQSRTRARSSSRGRRAPSPQQRIIVPASSIDSRRVSRRNSVYRSPSHRSPSRSRQERHPEYLSSSRSARSERRMYHGGAVSYGHRERSRVRERSRGRASSRTREEQFEHGSDFPRRGRTRIPEKLVCVGAVQEMNYSYSVEGEHIVVHRALGRPDIERLVEISEEIRRGGGPRSSPKAVSFYENTIVHDVAPELPPSTALTLYDEQQMVQAIPVPPPPSSISQEQLMMARYEPLMPPGPGTPVPGTVKRLEISTPAIPVPGKSREEKLARAEEKAIRAAEIAVMKEERAMITGTAKDEREAWKARNKAEELIAKVEERERKERLKYAEKASSRRYPGETVVAGRRVARNHKGEVVIIKG